MPTAASCRSGKRLGITRHNRPSVMPWHWSAGKSGSKSVFRCRMQTRTTLKSRSEYKIGCFQPCVIRPNTNTWTKSSKRTCNVTAQAPGRGISGRPINKRWSARQGPSSPACATWRRSRECGTRSVVSACRAAETAGDLAFDLEHPQVLFGKVVIEGHAEAVTKLLGKILLSTVALYDVWSSYARGRPLIPCLEKCR